MTMSQKQVCQLDFDDYFTGVTFADESPLEPGVYLLPARTVNTQPPQIPEGKIAKWDNGWSFEDIPSEEITPPTVEPPVLPVELSRRTAYMMEADPLFFKAQRGEATMEEWQAKVAEIKARFPKE
jgi:hypothetical protein